MISAITILFNPDLSLLRRQALICKKSNVALIWVDNNSILSKRGLIRNLAKKMNARLFLLEKNEGLAYGQNLGVSESISAGYSTSLILDQDSVPTKGMIKSLELCMYDLIKNGHEVAAVGPLIYDSRSKCYVDAILFSYLSWKRIRFEKTIPHKIQKVSYLISSGTLLRNCAWIEIGAMRNDLFIEFIDVEWGERASSKGWDIFVNCGSVLEHRMGENYKKVWLFGWKHAYTNPSFVRLHYYVRNGLKLAFSGKRIFGCRLYALWMIIQRVGFFLIFELPLMSSRKLIK